MPDWSYRTVLRPLLFRLPAPVAHRLAVAAMGTLARLPLGPRVIDLMGHMRPDPRLGRTLLGVHFPSPVGLGPTTDPTAAALPALARFGVGFLDVGPVTEAPQPGVLARDVSGQCVGRPDPPPTPGPDALPRRLRRAGPPAVPLRVGP